MNSLKSTTSPTVTTTSTNLHRWTLRVRTTNSCLAQLLSSSPRHPTRKRQKWTLWCTRCSLSNTRRTETFCLRRRTASLRSRPMRIWTLSPSSWPSSKRVISNVWPTLSRRNAKRSDRMTTRMPWLKLMILTTRTIWKTSDSIFDLIKWFSRQMLTDFWSGNHINRFFS